VDYASHSAQVDQVRGELAEALADLTTLPATVPMLSTVTGQWVDDAALDAEYWFANLRQTVQFGPAVDGLLASGVGTLVECSPHPVLAIGMAETDAAVVESLRRGDGGPDRFTASLARAHVRGTPVDWHLAPGEQLDLPTYAFQRQRYWLTAVGQADQTGLRPSSHPLLGAAVTLADAGGLLLTGRLSATTHPWLTDHAVAGTILVPAAALVELAIKAADEAGYEQISDLELQAPLILADHGSLQLQVSVQPPDSGGRAALAIYARPDDDSDWIRHAAGALASGDAPAFELTAWPPVGAEPDGGQPGVWRRGDEVFAEVVLPDGQQAEAARYGIHPALLDAALEPVLDEARQWPANWTGLSVWEHGEPAFRIRLAPAGEGAITIWAADAAGKPVLRADSVTLAPRPAGDQRARGAALLRIDWVPAPAGSGAAEAEIYRCPEPAADGVLADTVRAVTEQVAEMLRSSADGRLAFVTRAGELSHAAVRGLVRSAQRESPGRFVLIHLDGDDESLLGAAIASGEPELAVRDGALLVPRLARAVPGGLVPGGPVTAGPDGSGQDSSGSAGLDPQGTVLIVGTGLMGRWVARHLVTRHGVRRLVLASRRGQAGDLAAELRDLGADTTVAACDATDRDALAALLSGIPSLTGVVHCAGVVENGLARSLTPDQLGRVLAPKVDAAIHLHELTRHADLALFALFSSAAGVLGGVGQGAFAAANTFLDGLAEHRRATGLPAVSLAWGEWEPLAQDAPALLDAALDGAAGGGGDALLVPLRFDVAALRTGEELPPMLRGLARTRRSRRSAGGAAAALAQRLAGQSADAQDQILLDLVRGHVAAVLGHDSPPALPPDRAFKELGFDSLTAVELRNRLNGATGLRLPATLVFSYPTPAELARHLRAELGLDGGPAPVLGELRRLEELLDAASPDDGTHAAVARRLETLVRKWRGTGKGAASAMERPALGSASAEDLFALLDRELGPS
jgi:acyl transferase domain-containing protein/acyl carrier protein